MRAGMPSHHPMKKLVIILAAGLLAVAGCAGCGSSTEDEWGGYTQGEVKDLLKDPQFQTEIKLTAPPSRLGTIEQLYPTNEEIDDAELKKVHVQGEEAWEYKRVLEEGDWCIYMSEDPDTKSFLAQVGPCIAD